ncbi:hypothetical protein FRC04_009281 [Tulasnella sp. 424]|nr:hypothetical protein FRC04_009281 [Tulasnella sp. 424]KAG8973101.1 hypothetical protein FRC05_009110 [Tulasnella sp. 425]
MAINWRPVAVTVLVIPPALPPQWFAYGNASTSCKIVDGRGAHLFPLSSSSTSSNPESFDTVNPDFRFCEDMVQWDLVDADGQRAKGGVRHLIVGCDPGEKDWNPVMGPLNDPWTKQGSFWLYSYSSESAQGVPRKLEFQGFPKSSVFHPFGFDITYDPKTKQYRLFATNHGEKASSVEVFTLSPPPPSSSLDDSHQQQLQQGAVVRATYVRTLSHSSIVSPNNVAIISPTSFYLTNDHTLSRRTPFVGTFLHVFETFFNFPGGWVDLIEFDDDDAGEVRVTRAIDRKIPFANGIAMSPDGRTVAVASSTEITVSFYDRDATTNKLTYNSRVDVPFHPDNIAYDKQDGTTLYASGAPFYPDMIEVSKGKKLYAPSWVVAISPREPGGSDKQYQEGAAVPSHFRASMSPSWAVRTIYQSDGSGFSASATGFVDKEGGKLFAAGLFEPRGILQCE